MMRRAMSKKNDTRVLVLDASYDESMNQVIAKILDEFPFKWKGKNVLVKPNILSPNSPDKGVTTHPTVV